MINKPETDRKIYIMIVIDGAADRLRVHGKSPLEMAKTPALDIITQYSFSGLMQTLYDDLPKGSIVAQLGLLGYNPYQYFPKGRSYFEVPSIVNVNHSDLIFRANFVHFSKEQVLKSYNGYGITSEESNKIVKCLNLNTAKIFPEFELYNISDYRNILIIRNINDKDILLNCFEPHENEGNFIDISELISSKNNPEIAQRIKDYILFVNQCIKHPNVNSIFPWGYSTSITLPRFSDNLKGCIIGHMAFLHGFSVNMGLDFMKIGNSNWNTDYKGKGEEVIKKINEGYDFIYCHINGPDEASHMNDLKKKIYSIEQTDKHIISPILSYFQEFPQHIGAVAVCPDHYTNIKLKNNLARNDAHSIDAVPFIVWNNKQKDKVTQFSEDAVLEGAYGKRPINHLDLLPLMGIGDKLIIQKNKVIL